MDMKNTDDLKDELELVTAARDYFKSLRCSRNSGKVKIALLAGNEEQAYQKRVDDLERQLSKALKAA